jgi:hypothetical protein
MTPNHSADPPREDRDGHAGGPASIGRVLSPAPRDAWSRLVLESDESFAFHLPEWLDAACDVGGYVDASRLYEMRDGRVLVLPLARSRGRSTGPGRAASLPPNWGFGGVIAPGVVRSDEVAAIVADLASLPVGSMSLRPGPLAQSAWAAAVPTAIARVRHEVHDVDLAGGFDVVWKSRFEGSLRTAVRKAERARLEIRRETSGLLIDTFYELYRTWLDGRAGERGVPRAIVRWSGERREPLRRYRAVAAALGDACRTWVATLDGQPVASIIILSTGRNAVYWRGASDKRLANPTRANDLLMKLAIEEACAEGCHWFHMGESGGVGSLVRWKERFGARPVMYEEFRIGRSRGRPGGGLSGLLSRASRWRD